MIVNEISLVIQNKNDIRKLMADKKTKESSKEDYNHQPLACSLLSATGNALQEE